MPTGKPNDRISENAKLKLEYNWVIGYIMHGCADLTLLASAIEIPLNEVTSRILETRFSESRAGFFMGDRPLSIRYLITSLYTGAWCPKY